MKNTKNNNLKIKIANLKNKFNYTSYNSLLDDWNYILRKRITEFYNSFKSKKFSISLPSKQIKDLAKLSIKKSNIYFRDLILNRGKVIESIRAIDIKDLKYKNFVLFFKSFQKKINLFDIHNNANNNPSDLSLLPPPPIWSRAFIWTLSIGSLSLIGWSIFTTIEETIILSGEIITVTPEAKITAMDPGRITEVLVSPNQFVKKDMVLIIYEDDETNARLLSLKKRLSFIQYQRNNLYKSFDLRLRQLNDQITLNKNIVSKLTLLQKNGAISEINLLERESELNDLEINYDSVLIDKQNSLFQNAEQLEELQILILELEAKAKRFNIKSPVSGYIQNIKYQSPGERILANEVIINIIPDKELIAKTSIPSKVSAPIRIGMNAIVEVDAFPSSDFGAIISEVSTISPTTVSDDNSNMNSINQRTYVAELSLISPEMPEKLVISDLRSGMAITAKIKLRDKPIITSAFNIISDIFDPLAEQR